MLEVSKEKEKSLNLWSLVTKVRGPIRRGLRDKQGSDHPELWKLQ